ncbi:hypothetical protein [Streptosporangium saharense]|uniref:hypothetical protein n=1 Tax=Streptosporangium saharense TaxID=1706840 RepID=UPI003446C387
MHARTPLDDQEDLAMSEPTRAELADQIRAGVIVVSAVRLLQEGKMTAEEVGTVVADLAAERFPDGPIQLVLPTAYVAMMLARLAAGATGQSVEAVLEWIGAEAAAL